MNKFEEGQTLWILHETDGIYRNTIVEGITKCIYRGIGGYHRPIVQKISEDGNLGMTFGVSEVQIFETLEDLKLCVSEDCNSQIEELKNNIKRITEENLCVQELQDREESIEKILND